MRSPTFGLKAPQGMFRVVSRTKERDYRVGVYETKRSATDVADRFNGDSVGSDYYVYDDQGARVPSKFDPKNLADFT